jgi:hypothetical protein
LFRGGTPLDVQTGRCVVGRRASAMGSRPIGLVVVCLVVLMSAAGVARGQSDGSIVAWGNNGEDQCDVPPPNMMFVGVAAGYYHGLGLKGDGSIVAWGWNYEGECDVPSPNAGFVDIAAGGAYSLGLKDDGSIVAWGRDLEGQCDVPLPNTGFVGVAAGWYHSLGLRGDGSIVAWGWNDDGECDVPPPNTGFVGVAAGCYHSLGLKGDGSIVAWGNNDYGQCDAPAPNTGLVGVAAGEYHSLGLKDDGSIAAWGWNGNGQCDVPLPNTGFVGVAAGYNHSLGLKGDGSIVAWGWNGYGECNVPLPNTGFVGVAAGEYHSLGLRDWDTPVEAVFYATVVPDQGVVLRWLLPNCSGGVGLRVYRALCVDGPYTCVTPRPLVDSGSGTFVDETPWPGGTFWYELRVVLASGDEVLAIGMHPSVVVPGTLVTGIRYVTPNPSRGGVNIGYVLPAGWRSARLSVHDVAGRLVRRLGPTADARGFVTVDWDGTGDAGERMASGVYFVRLEVDGAAATQKLTLLR